MRKNKGPFLKKSPASKAQCACRTKQKKRCKNKAVSSATQFCRLHQNCKDFELQGGGKEEEMDCIKGGMNFDLGSGDDGEVGEQADEEFPTPAPTRIFTKLVDPNGDEVMVELATQEALTPLQKESLTNYMESRNWNWRIDEIEDPDMYAESDLSWDATFIAWLDGGDHQTENQYGEALGPIVFRAYSQMNMGIVWPDIIQQNSLLYPFFLSFNGGRVTVMTGMQDEGGPEFIQRHQDAIDNRILRVYRDMIDQSMTLPELLEYRQLAEVTQDGESEMEFSDDNDLINPDFQGGDDDCVKEDDWVLPKRKGPPFRASRCKGQEKEGNDGKVWTSIENNA